MNVEAEADALFTKYGTGNNPGPKCGVERSGSRVLIEALAERGITSARISEIIQTEKHFRVPINTIQRHRRKVCSCRI
jgi:hypothetical protein